MANVRTYKGYEIHKQHVGPCGWNVAIDGKTYSGMTGFRTLEEAKEWVNDEIDRAETMTTDTLTRFAVHANGTFWGIFDGADSKAAMQAAADEHGTEGNMDGMTAATLAETMRRIDADYRDNDMTIADGIKEWANCYEADCDDEGNIWIANPQADHWLDRDKLADFIAWVEKQ